MSSKDLQAAAYIPALIDAGVSSLKIEGRMKSTYYIATVVHAYRALIDEYMEKGVLDASRIAFYEQEIAKAEKLFISAGSDFHGPSRPDRYLGVSGCPPQALKLVEILTQASEGSKTDLHTQA